jgi:hypothetical protein
MDHEPILKWLQDNHITPNLQDRPEEVLLFDPEGREVTDTFLDRFESEFDYFQIESRDPLQVSIYTSDYNHHRGDTLVCWDGQIWSLKEGP